MRYSLKTLLALPVLVAAVGLGACGGSDDPGPATTTTADPDQTASVTVEQFESGFADATGTRLTPRDFPGGAVLFSFDDDGDVMQTSEAEAAFIEEFGTAQIYVVEPDGDPQIILDAVTGESRDDTPVESGGDTVRLVTKVAEPDGDGVIWSEQCVRYEKQKSLNACAWSGTKRYGKNVIVNWTATADEMDEAASRLDEAVSQAVAG